MREIHVRTYNGGAVSKKSGNLPRGVDNTAHDGDQQKLTKYMIL